MFTLKRTVMLKWNYRVSKSEMEVRKGIACKGRCEGQSEEGREQNKERDIEKKLKANIHTATAATGCSTDSFATMC